MRTASCIARGIAAALLPLALAVAPAAIGQPEPRIKWTDIVLLDGRTLPALFVVDGDGKIVRSEVGEMFEEDVAALSRYARGSR